MALSERSGEAFLAGESLDDLHLDFHGSGGGEKVQQTTLDAFAEQHGLQRLDFIKVDIEGSEIPFLRGARETLKRFRPAMLIEMNPDTLRAFGASAADLAGLLREMSYKLLRVHRLWRGLTPLRELPTSLHINVFALPESLG
jgi:hypothetical protein